VRPGTYQRIDEEQFFALQLNGPATPASVQANVWCAVEGLGERVPVRLIDGAQRTALLKAQGWTSSRRRAAALCHAGLQPAPHPARKVQLVYGKGVATPSGVANSVEKRYNYQVREPFAAELQLRA
jgi:hypothetical protein